MEIIPNKSNWGVKIIRILIKSLIKKKTFVKAAKILCDLDIVMLEQILDIEGSHLLTWQQLKISRRKSKKGKKVT